MQSIRSFQEASQYLAQFYGKASDSFGLDNIRQLAEYLGNPEDQLRVIHVAGTSGKTSTAYYISALLSSAGQKTGLTISPTVDEINERVQINGQPLSEADFCSQLSEFAGLIAKAPLKPSWFELMIAFAYWVFARAAVDYAVVEVGLGGLNDATNIASRSDKICIITDIGFDHTNVLGKSLSEIAAQKNGIIKPNNAVFSYQQLPEIMEVIKNQASCQGAKLHIIKETKVNMASMPAYQLHNWSLAYQVYQFLKERDNLKPLTAAEIKRSQGLLIPGRMDIRRLHNKTVIFDGAHNEQKMTALMSSFRALYPNSWPAILLAMRDNKDYQEVATVLTPLASRVITTTFSVSQDLPLHSMSAEKLAQPFKDKLPVKAITDPAVAFRDLLSSEEDILIITGSLYLVGQLRKTLA